MKKVLLSFSFIILLISCKKEEIVPIYFPGDMKYGKATAKKNGTNWIASGSAHWPQDEPFEYFGILVRTYSVDTFLREQILFNEIPFAIRKHKMNDAIVNNYDGIVGASYATVQDDGDVGEDYYKLDEGASDNELEITFLDTIANLVKGTFTATFIIADKGHKVNPLNPDKVKFSNGSFEVKFVE